MATLSAPIKGDISGNQEIYLLDMVTGECLQFQFVPRELQYSPDANFVGIQTIGRNNPKYHYTGGEDTLTFEISYIAAEENRQDVLKRCKWVEAMCRADGYEQGPHIVRLIFGDLYKKSTWIVKSAPYTLSLFNKEYGYAPTLAIQTITLCRVTETNRRTSEIIDYQS